MFDKRPPTAKLVPGTTDFVLVKGGSVLDAPLTFRINGGYNYARINFNFC